MSKELSLSFADLFAALPYPALLWRIEKGEAIRLIDCNPESENILPKQQEALGKLAQELYPDESELVRNLRSCAEKRQTVRHQKYLNEITCQFLEPDLIILFTNGDFAATPNSKIQMPELEFLDGMSHEIRTPLNSVLGMLQLLKHGELDPEQEEYVQIALDSGRSLLEIVNDLLDLVRIEKGHITLAEVPFDPVHILHSVAGLFTPAAKAKDIVIRVDAPTQRKNFCLGDANRLRQILFNLIGNAVKFAESGEIRVELIEKRVEDAQDDHLDFVISDSSGGISSGWSGQIFRPFHPKNSLPSGPLHGTGLGLPIVRRLVEAMGGGIALTSESERGAQIRISLAFTCGPTLSEPARFELPKLQILLVEDDNVNQLAVRNLLSKAGHKVVSASDGREALTALDQIRFDLILMDVAMPNMDGMETTRRIRASNQPYADLPIIALTAHAMNGDRERFLAAGMNDYLAKPLDFEAFNQTLMKVMEKRKRV